MTFRMTTSGQIQVWALMFEISPFEEAFSRDLQRAKREWRDEDRIWLVPGTEQVARWDVGEGGRFSECLIPSETMNLISVIHVDEGRRTYPPIGLPEGWPNPLPRRILSAMAQRNASDYGGAEVSPLKHTGRQWGARVLCGGDV